MQIEVVIDLMAHRGARYVPRPPKAPLGFKPALPTGEDDQEEAVAEELQALVGARIGLLYTDAKGAPSRRRITIRSFARSATGAVLMQAFCHERSAGRCFRLDRVQAFYDLQTGEVLPGLATIVPGARQLATPAAPTSSAEDAVLVLRPCLNVLLFMATCDGLRDDEVDVLCQYARDSPVAANGVDDAELRRYLGAMHPDEAVFRESLRRFATVDVSEQRRTLDYVSRVIDVDGVVSEAEFHFASALRDFAAQSG